MSFNRSFKPTSNKYKHGDYMPTNKDKYVGELPVKYRSGLELRFIELFDMSPNYVQWSFEPDEFSVPYIFDGKKKRYHVDCWFRLSNGNMFIAEIKPAKRLSNPMKQSWAFKQPEKAKMEFMVYRQNCTKWHAAKQFAIARKIQFAILTEKFLEK